MSKLKQNLEKLINNLKANGFEIKIRRVKFNKDDQGRSIFFAKMDEPHFTRGDWSRSQKYRNEVKGKALFAREANGYTVVTLKKDGETFTGRSICSASDKFHGDIGSLRAISNALRTNNIKTISSK